MPPAAPAGPLFRLLRPGMLGVWIGWVMMALPFGNNSLMVADILVSLPSLRNLPLIGK
jgi:hypothetical protein